MSQPMDALAYANKIKSVRADVKQKIKSGELDIRDVLKNPPPELKNMTVFELVRSLNRYGRKRTLDLLRRSQIPETKTFEFITPRQINALIDDFS